MRRVLDLARARRDTVFDALALDLIVDPKSRDVRVNPASPDAPLLEILLAS